MTPTPEASERQRKAAFKAWETIRRKKAAAAAAAEATGSAPKEGGFSQEAKLSLERDLQSALRENIEQLEPGMVIIDGGREKISASGRMDILAMDRNQRLVVIELKLGTATHEVLGQIQSYMGDLIAETGKPVRGIIIAHDFDNRAVAASNPVPDIELRKYGFNFSFTRL